MADTSGEIAWKGVSLGSLEIHIVSSSGTIIVKEGVLVKLVTVFK